MIKTRNKTTALVLFSILGTLLALGIFVFTQTNNRTLNTAVLDCTNNCQEKTITYTIKDCADDNHDSCQRTLKDLDKVTFITDETNYFTTPLTQQQYTEEAIEVDLFQPWDLEFLPDGSMLVTERSGAIKHITNGEIKIVGKLGPIVAAETGLLGLAIDPDFENNNYVYVYYTANFDTSKPEYEKIVVPGLQRVLNRISRFTFKDDEIKDETIILDNIPGSGWHSGGRIAFGPDEKLYATTGDAAQPLLAEDETFLGGKVLRMNTDGSIPNDNPWPESFTYAAGFRNPQGLAWNSAGKLYISGHGHSRFDEINHIQAGGKYGWPTYQCDELYEQGKLQTLSVTIIKKITGSLPLMPVSCYKQVTLAPSGMTFINDTNHPWHDNMFLATLRGKQVRRYILNKEMPTEEIFYINTKDTKPTLKNSNREEIIEILGQKFFDDLFTVDDEKLQFRFDHFVSELSDEQYIAIQPFMEERKYTGVSRRVRDVEFYDGSLYVIGDSYGLTKISPK